MSECLHLPRLSSWASSSCRSFSRDDWETTVQAGNTCRPSHTNKTAVSSLSAASDRPTANGRRRRRISLCSVPVCPSAVSLLLDLSLLGLPPAVWPGALQPSPPWTWMSYLEWALLLLSLLPPLSLPNASYFYSFVLRKQVQIKFWAHQHFQGPAAAEWQGKHWNTISRLDTLFIAVRLTESGFRRAMTTLIRWFIYFQLKSFTL